MTWRKLPKRKLKGNICSNQVRLLLYKVRELGFVWVTFRALDIMKIKLTRDSPANEADKGSNHLLSKMSPTVI